MILSVLIKQYILLTILLNYKKLRFDNTIICYIQLFFRVLLKKLIRRRKKET